MDRDLNVGHETVYIEIFWNRTAAQPEVFFIPYLRRDQD